MKLLDEMHPIMRRRRYSIRTEKSYCSWVKRYVRYHQMRNRDDLKGDERTGLYKHVLKEPLDEDINAERTPRRITIPVVLTREETSQIIALRHRKINCPRPRISSQAPIRLRVRFARCGLRIRDIAVCLGWNGAGEGTDRTAINLQVALAERPKWVKIIRKQGKKQLDMPSDLS